MLQGSRRLHLLTVSVSTPSFLCLLGLLTSVEHVLAVSSTVESRYSNPLNINLGPAPSPQDGPPLSANALRNTAYLPAQIGAIVGAYAFSLVLVAITLLALTKKRHQHLSAEDDEDAELLDQKTRFPLPVHTTAFTGDGADKYSVPNFSYPSPTKSEFTVVPASFIHHSPTSSVVSGPGRDPWVDQRVVAADRTMAQQQLEDLYKHVMEHEDAKQRGHVHDIPDYRSTISERTSISDKSVRTTISKKERSKPSNLILSPASDDQPGPKTPSLLAALRSPRKKSMRGVSISSPIMTPQSATFPHQESREMNPLPHRQYPPPPPPIPTNFLPKPVTGPITPNISPESIQSIDERLAAQMIPSAGHYRTVSEAPTEYEVESATTEHSQAPLVGLPASPRLDGRFPSLPTSPKPGATFQRSHNLSAVRTGGTLPLRAYEPPLSSPSAISHTTKQTVFERRGGPLSPMSARTPGTAVPYSPYQPFTPCMPVTPSLVTKEDRKRMRRMVPKTPTTEMVKNSEEIW